MGVGGRVLVSLSNFDLLKLSSRRVFAVAKISYNVRDIRSFSGTKWKKIWVRGEPSPEPYIPCYTPRRLKGGERSVVER